MNLEVPVYPLDQFLGHIFHCTDMKAALGLQRTFLENGYNITPGQYIILSQLWENEGIHQSALAETTVKDRHNITRMLNLLEKNGYIRREPDPIDKRKFLVFLTAEGRSLKQELQPIVTDYFQRCLAGLKQNDLDELKRIHHHILKNLQEISTDTYLNKSITE